LRGVAGAENVAAHSFGVAFLALLLSELVDDPLDTAKLLTIALLHDLPESVIGDLPAPATVHFPPGAKEKAEAGVLAEMVGLLPGAAHWRAWHQEFQEGSSPEGRLVRDADRLDVLIQAYLYQQATGNRLLDEFWQSTDCASFESLVARAIYEELRSRRQ
jgi:putative hydrolase of HD superfamily